MDQVRLLELANELTTIKLLSAVLILVVLALTAMAYSMNKNSAGDNKIILELSSLIGKMVKTMDNLNSNIREHSILLTEIKGLLSSEKISLSETQPIPDLSERNIENE